ncbi:MAG: hypothetical protein AMJ79_00795 [Phycisphaerae bacterium SM23_30]|nr:MAG: hypothetical protein AMJ79_00795 [Phycisphaerae bacterium SM23_30]
MKEMVRSSIFIMLTGALGAVILSGPARGQITRTDIDRIRKNEALSAEDLQRLEMFIQIQFEQMELAQSGAELNEPVRELLAITTSNSNNPLTRQQYSERLAEMVQARYMAVFQRGVNLSGQDLEALQEMGAHLKRAAALPLTVSDHPRIIDDLLRLLQDDLEDVRNYAAKGFTTRNIHEYLTQVEETDAVVQKVLGGLDQCLAQESSPEVIMQIATAANLPEKARGLTILKKCVDKRTAQYRLWQVESEAADSEILHQVFLAAEQKLGANDKRSATDLLRSAAELYWAAYQRYTRGISYRTEDGKTVPLVTDPSQQTLRTLLLVGEDGFRSICDAALQSPRSRRLFSTAILDQNAASLSGPYDALLGAGGQVQQAFNIYDGWAAPAELPAPSAEVIQKAENLQKIKQNSIIGKGF